MNKLANEELNKNKSVHDNFTYEIKYNCLYNKNSNTGKLHCSEHIKNKQQDLEIINKIGLAHCQTKQVVSL